MDLRSLATITLLIAAGVLWLFYRRVQTKATLNKIQQTRMTYLRAKWREEDRVKGLSDEEAAADLDRYRRILAAGRYGDDK